MSLFLKLGEELALFGEITFYVSFALAGSGHPRGNRRLKACARETGFSENRSSQRIDVSLFLELEEELALFGRITFYVSFAPVTAELHAFSS
jgi:hypothetical protein